jgi:putative CocE/NonD family hydrolase
MKENKTVVQMRWGTTIPMRDGVRLNATLYLPQGQQEPMPVIFTLTPYISQTYHYFAMYFAERGWPFLTVDARGRGNSEGTFRPNIQEAHDGHDVIEWLTRQSYCNGKVAMWGGSYAGHNQWAAASQIPSHLVTIAPVASSYLGFDFPLRNNVFSGYMMQWLTLVSGRAAQDTIFGDSRFWNRAFQRWYESGRPFRELDEQIGHPSAIFREWISHPEQDEYWDQYNPTPEQYSKIQLPIMTITGIYDGAQSGALKHYREHLTHAPTEVGERHYVVIGPWDHAGTRTPKMECGGLKVGRESLVDLPKLHLQWYAWTMQGGPKPDFLQRRVAYYVMGAEKWRYTDSLNAITDHFDAYYLSASSNPTDVFHSGRLSPEESLDATPSYYVYDPRDVTGATFEAALDWDLTDQRFVHRRVGGQLIYHSAPLVRDTEVSGFFNLRAWLSIDQPDTDFEVMVYEIGADGSSVWLSSDSIRARYRESLREAKLIRTTEPLPYDFNRFTFISRLVKRGNRLRLVIGPINSIHAQRNFNGGGVVAEESIQDAQPVHVKLFHDREHPSVLHVPIGRPHSSSEPTVPITALM